MIREEAAASKKKSPIMNRITGHLKPGKTTQRTESCPNPDTHTGVTGNSSAPSGLADVETSANEDLSADNRKNSLPDKSRHASTGASGNQTGTPSPKGRTKLFEGFRNTLKSKASSGLAAAKSPASPPPVGRLK